MRKILFAILLLFSTISVSSANNNPKPSMTTKSDCLNKKVISSPEQVKCVITVKRCSGYISLTVELSDQSDCSKAQNLANVISVIYQSMACD